METIPLAAGGPSVRALGSLEVDRWWRRMPFQKIGGRYRARVATSPQVQNRMVEILRMCTLDISNRDTATRVITQVIAE